jgi:hypothetical protein
MKKLKYLRFFENFGEETPSSITIEFASHSSYEKFVKHYIENDGSDRDRRLGNRWTYTQNWSHLTDEGLSTKDGLELRPGKFYPLFITYDRDWNRNMSPSEKMAKSDMIFLIWGGGEQISIISSNEHVESFDIKREYYDAVPNARPIYCAFENGLKVGEIDHRNYFKIVSMK